MGKCIRRCRSIRRARGQLDCIAWINTKEGRKEGRKVGRKEGKKVGRKEGKKVGRKEGRKGGQG